MAEPHTATPTTERDSFGHWLSGFVDGEGSFLLNWHKHKRKTRDYEVAGARFEIFLRIDDQAILEEIRTCLGVGCLATRAGRPGAKPGVRYYVSSSTELLNVIVPQFERYPLRAKKRHDFLIWKQAVEILDRVNRRPKVGRKGVGSRGILPKWTDEERAEFGSLLVALRKERTAGLIPQQ